MSTVDRLRVAGAELSKLEITAGDCLVLRGSFTEEAADVIGQYLVDNQIAGVLIIELPADGDLSIVDADEMAAAGWVRAPAGPPG